MCVCVRVCVCVCVSLSLSLSLSLYLFCRVPQLWLVQLTLTVSFILRSALRPFQYTTTAGLLHAWTDTRPAKSRHNLSSFFLFLHGALRPQKPYGLLRTRGGAAGGGREGNGIGNESPDPPQSLFTQLLSFAARVSFLLLFFLSFFFPFFFMVLYVHRSRMAYYGRRKRMG